MYGCVMVSSYVLIPFYLFFFFFAVKTISCRGRTCERANNSFTALFVVHTDSGVKKLFVGICSTVSGFFFSTLFLSY